MATRKTDALPCLGLDEYSPCLTRERTPAPVERDDIGNPEHYTFGGIEAIDYMRAKSTPEEFRGHLRLTVMKYISRTGHKDDALKDLKKAQWYLSRLINEIEGKPC